MKKATSRKLCAILMAMIMMLQVALPMVVSAGPPASGVRVELSQVANATPNQVSVLVEAIPFGDPGYSAVPGFGTAIFEIVYDSTRLQFAGGASGAVSAASGHWYRPTIPAPGNDVTVTARPNTPGAWAPAPGTSIIRIFYSQPNSLAVNDTVPLVLRFNVLPGADGEAEVSWRLGQFGMFGSAPFTQFPFTYELDLYGPNSDQFVEIYVGDVTLEVTVTGLGDTDPANVVLTHGTTVFTQVGTTNVFRATGAETDFVGTVYANAIGFVPDASFATIPALGVGENTISMTIDMSAAAIQLPTMGSLRGQVTDNVTGDPIEGATVTVFAADGTYIATATTNHEGNYVVNNIAAGTEVSVTASAAGYLPQTATTTILPAGTPTVVNFALVPTGDTSADYTLVVSVAGVPVAEHGNITVTLPGATFTRNGNVFTAISNAPFDGTITASAIGFNNGTAAVAAADFATTDTVSRPITLTPIQIPTMGSLRGTITDSVTGDPIEGATVTVFAADGAYIDTATTNHLGNYVVNNIAAGTDVTVTASAAGYLPQTRTSTILLAGTTESFALVPTGDTSADYTLIVAVAGVPEAQHSNITVTLAGATFTRNGNVFTAISDAPFAGTITAGAVGFENATAVVAAADFATTDTVSRTITLIPDEIPVGMGRLIGQVTNDATGLPIPGATVTLVTATGTYTTTTDGAGNYRFDVLPGAATVAASMVGFVAHGYTVTITEGEPPVTRNIALTPTIPGGGNFTTYVIVTSAARPISDASNLTVTHPDATFTRIGNGNVFTVTTANALTGNVTVTAHDFMTSNVTVTAAVTAYVGGIARIYVDVEPIEVPSGYAGLQGFVRRASDNSAIEDAVVTVIGTNNVSRTTTTDATGLWRFIDLDPDLAPFTVNVTRAPYYAQTRNGINVVVDDMTTIDPFLLVRGTGNDTDYTLTVRLVDRAGAPIVENATVMLDTTTGPAPMTFANGAWRATAAAAPITGALTAGAVGFLPTPAAITVPAFVDRVAVVTITLDRPNERPAAPGEIRGFVRVAPANVEAIAGATVIAIDTFGTRSVPVTTDVFGFYSITGLPAGTYTVVAAADTFNSNTSATTATITADDDYGHDRNVYLTSGPFGYVLFVNIEPTDACDNSAVTFNLMNMTRPVNNATWRFPNFGPMGGVIRANAPGFLQGIYEIDSSYYCADGIAFVTIRLTRIAAPGTIQGYVIDVTDPTTPIRVPNASVRVVNNETGAYEIATTDAEGFYRVEDLDPGEYTVIAWSDTHGVATSLSSPLTLTAATGINENVHVVAVEAGVNDYQLTIKVTEIPVSQTAAVTMAGVTFVRQGTTDVFVASADSMILGLAQANAGFARGEYDVTSGSYAGGRVAFAVIELEMPSVIVRFHYDGEVTERPMVVGYSINEIIGQANLIPVPATRYGAVFEPGEYFMGWFTVANPVHLIGAPNRAAAFNLDTEILENMLEVDGQGRSVFNLFGSWLQFGDVDGDGRVFPTDYTMLQAFFNDLITVDDIVYATADVNADGRVFPTDYTMLQAFFNGVQVILGRVRP